jgi:hypothetical protein
MTRPNLLSPASVAASLHTVQQLLYGTRGLHAMVMCFRRTPDGFSRELKRDVRMQLQLDTVDEWRLQQFLPMTAANDSQPSAA